MDKKPIKYHGEIIEMDFDETYEKFERFLYAKVRNVATPHYEELLQLARIALWQSYNGYDASRGFAFTTYLSWLIDRKILCYWRTQGKKIKPLSLDVEMANGSGDTFTLGDTTAAETPDIDAFIAVRQTLAAMNNTDRRLLVMHFAGYTQVDIGAVFNYSQPHTARKIKRAKAAFKQIYMGGGML